MLQPKSIKLSELTHLIGATIKYAFDGELFWIVADVTSHSYKAQDDRHFFVLAEKGEGTNALVAKVDAVAWKPAAEKIRAFEDATGQRFQNDIHVLVQVSVSYNATFGLKLSVHDIDINFTIGALEQEKRQVLLRLEKECAEYIRKDRDRYITRNNQLRLNSVLQKIAVVASNGTAGYEDFMHTLQNNPYRYTFFVDSYFTPVQGENNAHLVRKALIDIFSSGKNYDAVVIIRGGGSQTDFLIFDTFELGQAVAKFPIPVITGIGHQRNETIVDLMAHSPTKTPTKAAEFIVSQSRLFEERLETAQSRILKEAQHSLSAATQTLRPLTANIKNYGRMYLQNQNGQVEHFVAVFSMMTPENIFKLGFAMVKHQGKVTNSPAKIKVGDEIDVTLSGVEITATVTAKRQSDGSEFKL